MVVATVRTPHPEKQSLPTRRSATRAALSSSTMPVHRQWPILEVSASIGVLRRSSPIANHPRSGSQKSRLNCCLRSAARVRRLAARRASPASSAKLARPRSAAYVYPCTSHIALGRTAVREAHRVPRVLPALVAQAVIGGALVFEVAVTIGVAVLVDPRQRRVGGEKERVELTAAMAPPAELREEHDEQRRRVDAAVVDAPAAERQRRVLAEAHLVQDASGLLLRDGVHAMALEPGEGLQRAEREI